MIRPMFAILLALTVHVHAAPVDQRSVRVIDGDTIEIRGDAVYRLVGLNTPETGSRAKCSAERELGNEAKHLLQLLVSRGGLDLQRVACACRSGTEGTMACNHGRLCGVLRAGSRDVATTIVGAGLAEPYVCSRTRCPPLKKWCQ